MRVAAIYDIHGNLPVLEAVMQEIRQAGIDQVVVGGDVLPGPMPRETLDYSLDLDIPVDFIYGNGERAVLAQISGNDPISPNDFEMSCDGWHSSFSPTTSSC
jgi:predicted phosphodiesterase